MSYNYLCFVLSGHHGIRCKSKWNATFYYINDNVSVDDYNLKKCDIEQTCWLVHWTLPSLLVVTIFVHLSYWTPSCTQVLDIVRLHSTTWVFTPNIGCTLECIIRCILQKVLNCISHIYYVENQGWVRLYKPIIMWEKFHKNRSLGKSFHSMRANLWFLKGTTTFLEKGSQKLQRSLKNKKFFPSKCILISLFLYRSVLSKWEVFLSKWELPTCSLPPS